MQKKLRQTTEDQRMLTSDEDNGRERTEVKDVLHLTYSIPNSHFREVPTPILSDSVYPNFTLGTSYFPVDLHTESPSLRTLPQECSSKFPSETTLLLYYAHEPLKSTRRIPHL